ncbi:GMC oxidoreductase [Gordonia sp. VNQ95]|uniref:GMC oxidoreductase n=1 Tax=Gordonia sp. VNQ95 TaxID=3156619 RepID=UPI0032B3C358
MTAGRRICGDELGGVIMDRRSFLRMSAGGAVAAGMSGALWGSGLLAAGRGAAAPPRRGVYERLVPEIFRPVPAPPQHSEAIVIGSGFGGAVSALRLAEAGIATTVLERGSRWPHDPWREIFGFDGRMLWHAQRSLADGAPDSTLTVPAYAETLGAMAAVDDFGGIFEISWHHNSAILCGAAVGGGSVVYIGITAQSERTPFDEVFGGTVNYDEMARVWYPKALAGLGATVVPADVYRDHTFSNARDFARVARSAGYQPHALPGNWRWNVVRDEIAGRAKPMATSSALANSNGSLNSLTFSYLPRAEATGKATIHPRHQVNGIHIERSGRYVLDVDYVSPYGDILARRVLTTDRLVLAAGCLGTNRLLVAARDTGTLPNLNEHIGTGWGNNGNGNIDIALGGTRKDTQSAVGAQGFFDTDGPFARAVVNSTFSLGPLDAAAAALDTSAIKVGITSVDHSRGTFRYHRDTGRVVLDWPAAGNGDVAANCMRIGHRLAEHSGLPVSGVLYEPDLTWAHCMGGATLGTACDEYGRVKGYQNLYVNDGAMLPGSAAASNPSLTITAVAERNIAAIIAAGG